MKAVKRKRVDPVNLKIVWRGIPIQVKWHPQYFENVDHMELRSEYQMPCSKTGYRSIFVMWHRDDSDDFKAAADYREERLKRSPGETTLEYEIRTKREKALRHTVDEAEIAKEAMRQLEEFASEPGNKKRWKRLADPLIPKVDGTLPEVPDVDHPGQGTQQKLF